MKRRPAKNNITSTFGLLILVALLGVMSLLLIARQYPQTILSFAKGRPVRSEVALSFHTPQTTLALGDTVSLDVVLNTGLNAVSAIDLVLDYPSDVFSISAITQGEFLPIVLVPGSIENGRVTMTLGSAISNAAIGEGVVARITLTPLMTTNKGASIGFNQATQVAGVGTSSPLTVSLQDIKLRVR